MLRFVLVRSLEGDQGTFGRLISGRFICWLGELPWRDNEPYISRIFPADYYCTYYISDKNGETYQLSSVQGRTVIQIHIANFFGDVALDLKSDVAGCMGPGSKLGFMTPKDFKKPQMAVHNSEKTLNKLFEFTGKKNFNLRIIDAFTPERIGYR